MLNDQAPPYHTIIFDCDSTLSAMEGIDEICAPEQKAEIARLTEQAMRGEVPLEQVFGRRLELVQPTREALERVGRAYVEKALPHVRACIALLVRAEKRVAIVSGGLLPAVKSFGAWLGIDEVHAVPIHFQSDGSYAGFEAEHPLANSGGKIELVRQLGQASDARPMVLIGDGATDLEAAGEVQRFIAFGGVERREQVFAVARVCVDAPDFRQLLPHLLTKAELEAARAWPEFASLFDSSF